VDTNPGKFELAKSFVPTDCINPKDHEKPIQQVTIEGHPHTSAFNRPGDLRLPVPGLDGCIANPSRQAQRRGALQVTLITVSSVLKKKAPPIRLND
jgi:hypothetical protein